MARIALTLALCAVAPSLGAQSNTQHALERQVVAYFKAMGRGDIAGIERALAPDYLVIGGDGKLETRSDRLAWLRVNRARLGSLIPIEVRVRVYSTTAVATGLVTIPADSIGPAIRERFTQVWLQRNNTWRMVSGQITIVR